MLVLQAALGHEECVEMLGRYGGNPVAVCHVGKTPFHIAAAAGTTSMLYTLIEMVELGVTDTLYDNDHYTPLHWACYAGKYGGVFCYIFGDDFLTTF